MLDTLLNLSDLQFLILKNKDNNGNYLLELMRLNEIILVNLLASGLTDGRHGKNGSLLISDCPSYILLWESLVLNHGLSSVPLQLIGLCLVMS